MSFLFLHDDDYTNSESFANLVQYIRKQYSTKILIVLLNYYQTLQVITWVLMKRQW